MTTDPNEMARYDRLAQRIGGVVFAVAAIVVVVALRPEAVVDGLPASLLGLVVFGGIAALYGSFLADETPLAEVLERRARRKHRP